MIQKNLFHRRFVPITLLLLMQSFGASAGLFSSSTPCSVPAGFYSAQQLGAGDDSLILTVTSDGDVRGVYRLLPDSNEQGSASTLWFDKSYAYASCQGNFIELYASQSGHTAGISLMWNPLFNQIDITGNYTGTPTWPRWTIKKGLQLATIGAVAYTSWYIFQHRDDFNNLYKTRKITPNMDQVMKNVPDRITAMANYVGVSLKDLGSKYGNPPIWDYLSKAHLYDFTLPALGALTGSMTSFLVSNKSSYYLTGSGQREIPEHPSSDCTIPKGIYRSKLISAQGETVEVVVPVKLPGGPSAVTVMSSSNTTYYLPTENFRCQGNELTFEWKESSPPSRGAISAFYSAGQGLKGTGILFQPGWFNYEQTVPLHRLQFVPDSDTTF